MSQFHQRTIGLLGTESFQQKRPVDKLLEWAKKNAIRLPASYLEWATFDDGSLLQRYSNEDRFWFNEPEIVEIPGGVKGLRFNSENQQNYDRIVALDQGDDPPVFFAWISSPPWIINAEHFSEALFAQVFDWQYLFEFRQEDPAYKEISYYGNIILNTDACLKVLRQHYEESVTTRFIVEEDLYSEYRFIKSPTLRITVTVMHDLSTNIRVTGQSMNKVKGFEVELRSLLVEEEAKLQTWF